MIYRDILDLKLEKYRPGIKHGKWMQMEVHYLNGGLITNIIYMGLSENEVYP